MPSPNNVCSKKKVRGRGGGCSSFLGLTRPGILSLLVHNRESPELLFSVHLTISSPFLCTKGRSRQVSHTKTQHSSLGLNAGSGFLHKVSRLPI